MTFLLTKISTKMKAVKFLSRMVASTCLVMAMSVSFVSCSDDDEPEIIGTTDSDIVMNLSSASFSYDENGVWSSCYDTSLTGFSVQDFSLTHSASSYDWAGVTYYSWMGFCPSRSTDNADHSDASWTDYQWGAITGGGVAGDGVPYVLGMWDVNESVENVPESPVCAIRYKSGAMFDPEEIYVTNSAWDYYAMKNGSAYSKKFTSTDWCILHVKGVRNGVLTGEVKVYLAQGTDVLNGWKRVDLDALGDVDMIYFQMTSSDSGQWGMNTPAYFCIDRLGIDVD